MKLAETPIVDIRVVNTAGKGAEQSESTFRYTMKSAFCYAFKSTELMNAQPTWLMEYFFSN